MKSWWIPCIVQYILLETITEQGYIIDSYSYSTECIDFPMCGKLDLIIHII